MKFPNAIMLCPSRPMQGMRKMVQPFEACPTPDVCKKRGCLLVASPQAGEKS